MDLNYVSVPLGQSGKVALVDSEDAERVAMHNWIFMDQGQGPVYAYRMVRGS